jgi:hypothetical protein
MADDPRPLAYDPRRKSLYLPGKADDFFTLPGSWELRALCAELSRLSYCDDGPRRLKSLARVGLEELDFLDEQGTQVLVARDSRRAIVAFRGTDDPRALLSDLNLPPVQWGTAGRVHRGFADYLGHVRARLAAIIKDQTGRELVFTGHSLGAAAATLAANVWPESTLFAFGSPRVGDVAFAATITPGRVQRFVDCCDIVCRVPPEEFGYVHVGGVLYLTHDRRLVPGPAAQEVASDQRRGRREYFRKYSWAVWRNVFLRDFADHAPVNYVTALQPEGTR